MFSRPVQLYSGLRALRKVALRNHAELAASIGSLWAGAGPPGGTVRRAAVRKRGSGSMSLYEHRLPE